MGLKSHYLKARDALFYLIVLFLIRTLRAMPRRWAIAMMRMLAKYTFRFAKKERRKTIRHLTMAYGQTKSAAEIEKMAREVFRHFFTVAADFIRLPVILKHDINKITTVEGIEHLDKAMVASENGIMMLTAHFGNWELLGAWLARNGYKMRVVGTPLFDPRLDRKLVDIRNRAGYTNIARGSATRDIIRSLREGYAVGMLIDQDTKAQGIFVNFFGRPTHTPTGPVLLARKFKVPIVPIFMRLCDDLTYHIECLEPIKMEYTNDQERDVLEVTQKCSDVYEEMIGKYPSQWVWMHKRWKTRPRDFAND